jgi:uncharacterized protein (DUF433 family)
VKEPIVEEAREYRIAHTRESNFDLHQICENLREFESTLGDTVVRSEPRRVHPTKESQRLKLAKKAGIVMNTNWRDQVESTPDVLRGKPRLKGTRIPVSLILGYLAAGKAAQEIIAELPDLNETQIAACLDYARDLAEFEVPA